MSYRHPDKTYGWDRMSTTLFIAGMILLLTTYGAMFGIALLVYSFWRTRSHNITARMKEATAFETWEHAWKEKVDRFLQGRRIPKGKFHMPRMMEKLRNRRYYIVTNCPSCYQKVRLPKGKGKIIVTCPRCCSEFRLKT